MFMSSGGVVCGNNRRCGGISMRLYLKCVCYRVTCGTLAHEHMYALYFKKLMSFDMCVYFGLLLAVAIWNIAYIGYTMYLKNRASTMPEFSDWFVSLMHLVVPVLLRVFFSLNFDDILAIDLVFSIYRAHRNETKSFWNVENRQLIAQINVLCEKGQIHAKGQMVGKVDFIAWQISWGLCIRNGHNRNARRELLNHKLLVFRYVKFHDCIAISEFKMPHARYIAGYCVNECQDILPTQKQSSRQQTISKYRPPHQI